MRKRTSSRKGFWFVGVLLILVAAVAAVGALLVIRSHEGLSYQELGNRLETEARNKVTVMAVWYGSVQNQIDNLAHMDMLRLAATEISYPESGEPRSVVDQLPFLQRVFADFLAFSEFRSVGLLDRKLKLRVSSVQDTQSLTVVQRNALDPDFNLPDFSPEMEAELTGLFQSGKVALLPIFQENDRLMLRIACPVFAPDYVEERGQVNALLLFTLDVTERVARLGQAADTDPNTAASAVPGAASAVGLGTGSLRSDQSQQVHLLQRVGTHWEWVRKTGITQLDWPVSAESAPAKAMPLAERRLSENDTSLYCLALNVPGMPWYVLEGEEAAEIKAELAAYTQSVWGAAAVAAAFCFLLVGLFWWWLVGRRERATANELNKLYHTVDQQEGMLRSINSTLPSGIVLTDERGVIQVTNNAFAAMFEHVPATLLGLALEPLLVRGAPEAQCETADILEQLQNVLQDKQQRSLTCTIAPQGKSMHYHVVSAPFQGDGEFAGVVSVFQDITNGVEAQRRTEAMVRKTIQVLIQAMEAVDPYLKGHSVHTRTLAEILVQRLHLTAEDRQTILIAADLFQVGMLRLPRSLVSKQEALSKQERTQLEQHVEYAREALTDIDFGVPVLDAIYQMYERLDGSGYPLHLRAEAIGIHARILAVANTFCAVLRPRSYRTARSVADALNIFASQPQAYDAAVVGELKDFLNSSAGESFLKQLLKDSAPE